MARSHGRGGGLAALLLVSASCAGCAPSPWRPPEGCVVELAGRRPLVLEEERVVDLLVVLDDGVARSPAVARSLERLSGLIEGLSRSDLDGDGRRDVPDWRSVHVGVIDADRGAPGADALAGCSELERGLLRVGDASCAVDRAEGVPEGVLRFGPNVSPSSDSVDLACLVSARGSCALPQPLEATLEALSPEAPEPWTRPGYVPPRFADAEGREILPGLACSADGGCAHAGLLQPESVLVVVVITERDDCSLTDTGVLEAGVSLPTACARAHAAGGLRDVQRYVDGLVGLRADPGRLVLAIQAGLPTDGLLGPIDTVLGDPRLVPREEGSELVPSCATSEVSATPPTRWLEVARQLSAIGASVVLGSICERDADFVAQLRARVAAATQPFCLGPGQEPEHVMLDRCVVRESLPPGARCSERGGRVFLDLDASGAEICLLTQVSPEAASPGWFVDDEALAAQLGQGCLTGHPRSVRVTPSTAPHGALRVTCRYAHERSAEDVICDDEDESRPCTEGMLCDVADDRCGLGGTGLVCDAFQLRCMPRCERDEDCPDPFEGSGLCDPRTAGEAADRELVPRWLLEPGRVEQPRRVCASLVCRGP